MFAASSLAPAGIAAAAAKAGVVTDGSADATANEALFQREPDNNLAIASQLQLNATPTWVVGDQLFQGQGGYDALRQAIARARAKAGAPRAWRPVPTRKRSRTPAPRLKGKPTPT